jgi:hypothetical protein
VERLKPADVQQAAKLIFSGKNEFVAIQMPESDAESDNQDTKKGFNAMLNTNKRWTAGIGGPPLLLTGV